ncbi:MAG TPA: EAL domain-containing protein [Vicinamibacterales bacterium]|nr:EAL domain-containing protein [Vicinamibacterales bacterium]
MSQPHATLLLVDDDAMNRDALSRRLTRTGYNVLTAESGADALGMINSHRIDAVLLDVMMPGMSGLDTLRSLRQSRSVSDLPVIMVTAKDGSDDMVEALDLGANDYVTKPIDYAVALARIRAQVTARRADPLTGLPNRLLFSERINNLLKADPRQPFAVLFMDVDRFKVINDSLGHAAGDELLSALATRLQHALRATDCLARLEGEPTLARIGGDEFTVLLHGIADVVAASAVAERLRAAAAAPFQVHGREIVTSLSIGVVMSADRYQRADDMIRDADTAMYRAKKLGKARCEVFDTSMLAAAEERLELETDLRRAIAHSEFEVFYQPIVSLAAEKVTGFEALIRWRHPTRGLVSPADFIPIAEDTGLIVPIGSWVLREACLQIKKWERECPESADLVVNVNLSARQCMHPDLLQDVARILAETGCPAERVKLEITEGVVLENSDAVSEILHKLRNLGVQLGLDDFGMGYSALSYLQRFPFQTIKIDRTFVSGMKETGNTEIIRAIVSMAAGLDMNVTAEGVETADQVSRLQDLACEFGQGYYFQRPLTAADATKMLASGLPKLLRQP